MENGRSKTDRDPCRCPESSQVKASAMPHLRSPIDATRFPNEKRMNNLFDTNQFS
jgi:hypothetical protein